MLRQPPIRSVSAKSSLVHWLLVCGAAAALLTIAVVAWRAADRQREAGAAAMRQTAQDVAARLLAGVKRNYSPFDSAGFNVLLVRYMAISRDWLKSPGGPEDWVFGPWPQPESEWAGELRKIQELANAGSREEAIRRLQSSPFAMMEPGQTWASSHQIANRTWFEQSTELKRAVTASGLPLGPMLARLRLNLADSDQERRQQAVNLLNAAQQWPSVLTRPLTEEALVHAAPDVSREEWREKAEAVDRLREAVRHYRTAIFAAPLWLEGKWHSARLNADAVLVRSRQQVMAAAELAGLMEESPAGLPDGWHCRPVLDGEPLSGPARDELSVLTSAASGSWIMEVWTRRSMEPFAGLDDQLTRQRWLISGATAAILGALSGFLVLTARQRRLNAMMSNFVAAVSHELRAPVGSMGLLAERLRSGRIESPEEAGRYHDLIGGECRRLSGTIENVLAFSRMERGRLSIDPELCDLRALVNDAADLVRPLADDRGIALHVSLPDDPVEAEIDPGFIRQALLNLLDNALKFSPPQSTVQIHLRRTGSRIAISVSDEGPGIPPSERDRIFQPFYRIGSELRRETQGIGIGLAIARHAIESHGGTIRVSPSPSGHGSSFHLEFPPFHTS